MIFDTKKFKDKNYHFCIFEEVPISNSAAVQPKNKKEIITSFNKSILDQQELALFNEDKQNFIFHNVQFLTSLLDTKQDRSLLDRKIIVEVHETYFQSIKGQKDEFE